MVDLRHTKAAHHLGNIKQEYVRCNLTISISDNSVAHLVCVPSRQQHTNLDGNYACLDTDITFWGEIHIQFYIGSQHKKTTQSGYPSMSTQPGTDSEMLVCSAQ